MTCKPIRAKYLLLRIASLLLLLMPLSCRHDSGSLCDAPDEDAGMIVRITIPSVQTPSATTPGISGGYEEGSMAENFIDVHNSCRVLFFATDNTFLGTLRHMAIADIEGSGYKEYDIIGIPPENLPSDFRIMVAANWPDMSAIDSAVVGGTTIDDICHTAESQFSITSGFTPDPEAGALIPFFGIRSFSGITAAPGYVTLPGSIGMLRALAKVEVIFDSASTGTPEEVRLCGLNLNGYCAPSGVYSQDDYGDGSDWESDYLHRLHIPTPDNGNEPDAPSRVAPMTPANGGETCRWTIYVPEYRNLLTNGSPAPGEAHIEFRLPAQSPSEEPFILYFRDYTSATPSSSRYNIERNNIYRFHVSMQEGRMVILTPPWNYRPQPGINL